MRRRLLITHFLRRLLDNDLIAPGADRHQVLSVTIAALVSTGAFLTVAFSMKYLFSPIQSPAETAIVALDDVSLMSGLSMIVMALLAVAEWDALSLDARDTAILGPLPVSARGLALAQLAALLLFASVFALMVNGVPSLLMPLVRVSRLAVGAGAILRLIAAQVAATTLAGAFGFASVVALRELLRALTGAAWFSRAAAAAQAALVVLVAIALLTLPALCSRVESRWTRQAGAMRMPPPVWFAGLYDWLGGPRLEQMPPTLPPKDAPAFEGILRFERGEAVRYSDARGRLAALGATAARATGILALIAFGAWTWNSRRLPHAPPAGAGRAPHGSRRPIERLLARRQLTRAGFRFALQTLSRSVPHRVVVAAAIGIAVAVAAATLRTADLAVPAPPASVPLALLAAQALVLIVFVTGFRQACRIPASLLATPSFLLAWSGHRDAFVAGVRRACLVCGALALGLMAPVHAYLLGPRLAAWHTLIGLLLLGILSASLFGRSQQTPLVSGYEPSGNVLGLAPIYLAIALAVFFGLAWIEREVLQDAPSSVTFAIVLAATWAGLEIARRWRRGPSAPELWEEAPSWETQRLSLSE